MDGWLDEWMMGGWVGGAVRVKTDKQGRKEPLCCFGGPNDTVSFSNSKANVWFLFFSRRSDFEHQNNQYYPVPIHIWKTPATTEFGFIKNHSNFFTKVQNYSRYCAYSAVSFTIPLSPKADLTSKVPKRHFPMHAEST
jgi:hypothetical protein